jgi:DNA-binding transcriptional LysR family regulator
MDKLRGMEVFVAVADAGSFAGAGRALSISTVMVSKYIADLELRINASLIQRTTRRLSLTEIGERFCAECRQILTHVRNAENDADDMRATARGVLKLVVPVAFGSTLVAPAMVDYLAQHPEVSLELELSNRSPQVIAEGLCAAVHIGKLDDSTLIGRPLRSHRAVVCASPAYLERRGAPQTPADLAQHDCLDFLRWQSFSRWQLGAHFEVTPSPPIRFRSNSAEALKQAALKGMGIAILTDIFIKQELEQGSLVSILAPYVPPPDSMNLIYPRDRHGTPKMTSFIAFFMQRFA